MTWESFYLTCFLTGLLLTIAPSQVFAHDNLGGDELAVANWMLIAALVVLVMGILAGIWAWRAGQFSNIEESKYRMLDTAEDFDAIMAEADARASSLVSGAAKPPEEANMKDPRRESKPAGPELAEKAAQV